MKLMPVVAAPRRSLPQIIALLALLAAVGGALLLAAPWPAAGQVAHCDGPMATDADYDNDDDALIEICTADQLNAIRYDLNGTGNTVTDTAYNDAFPNGDTTVNGSMGCMSLVCQGYELMQDITISATYTPWTPINLYLSEIHGNGHTISGLHVTSTGSVGMFARLGNDTVITDIGLINPIIDVVASGPNNHIGTFAGESQALNVLDNIFVRGGTVTVTGDDVNGVVNVGGLVGNNVGTLRLAYSTASVTASGTLSILRQGGLVGRNAGTLVSTYAAGPVTSTASVTTIGVPFSFVGGLIGSTASGHSLTDSHCDTEAAGVTTCIGSFGNTPQQVAGYTTAELQEPLAYCPGTPYENWNLDLHTSATTTAPDGVGDNPWDFGSTTEYPTLRAPAGWHTAPPDPTDPANCAPDEPPPLPDSPPPSGPPARGPVDTPYNPAHDHPEDYDNDQYGMTARCSEVELSPAGRNPQGATVTIDLGSYRGEVILHLSTWTGEYFASYESQGIAMPDFPRSGQVRAVRIVTDPAQTRFRLDSVSPTTNLVLGYADCRTDDPEEPAPAATPTPTPAPAADKEYRNATHNMTASCAVRRNAEGEATGATLSFDLGDYEGEVILAMSIRTGDYYSSYESQDLTAPEFRRDGQRATVEVVTDPGRTRFRLDSVSPTTNLIGGYADCRDAGG